MVNHSIYGLGAYNFDAPHLDCMRCSQVLCWSSPPITADRQPIVAYPKLGRTLHSILLVSVPDPFSSRPNIKEEKAVWLASPNIKEEKAVWLARLYQVEDSD